MNRLNLTLVMVVLLTSGTTAFGDWIYNPSTGHWYQLTPQGLTWQQAEDWAVTNGGHLVSINDAAENAWVDAQFPTDGLQRWIGLHQPPGSPEPSGGWVWVSGEPVTYTNWDAGEPSNTFNPNTNTFEMVATMYGAQLPASDDGKWNDTPDLTYFGFSPWGIVERDSSPTVPTVSEWGLGLLLLVGTVSGAVLFKRRMKVT